MNMMKIIKIPTKMTRITSKKTITVISKLMEKTTKGMKLN